MFFPFLPPLAIQAISCAIPYFIPIFYSFSLLFFYKAKDKRTSYNQKQTTSQNRREIRDIKASRIRPTNPVRLHKGEGSSSKQASKPLDSLGERVEVHPIQSK